MKKAEIERERMEDKKTERWESRNREREKRLKELIKIINYDLS